jgi:DNA polymerase-1
MTDTECDKSSLERCPECPHGLARMVGSRGNPESPFVIVGEAPGVQEVKNGVAFCGPSGKVLQHALSQHPDMGEPYFLYAMQCFPGTKTKDPAKVISATRQCNKRLLGEIKKHPRKIILSLGNSAIWATTGDFSLKSTQCRGKRFESPLATNGIVASVHPAYLLRGSGSLRQFMADIDYACKLSKGTSTKRYELPEFKVASSVRSIYWLADEIAKHPYCAADIETGGYDGFDHLRDRILCCGFCFTPGLVYVVPEALIPHLNVVFRRAQKTRFIWHNGKFDTKFLHAKGINEARIDEDTMLLSYALDEIGGLHDLEQLTSDILDFPDWKFMIKPYLGTVKGVKKTYADIPTPILHDYMSRDISATFQIFPFLRNQVRSDKLLEQLYTQSLVPYAKYFIRIERRGILPDLEQVKKNQIEKTAIAKQLEGQFNTLAVEAEYGMLNIRSPIQVSKFLYDILKLRDARKPKKRPDSTDEKTLITLPHHPAVVTLLKYREVHKGLSTYVNSVEEHVGADGRVHCTYLVHGTTTGRPASRNPNLLNIPRDPALRNQFQAGPDNILMEVDVSQAELRVLAELSGDEELYKIYTTKGASIHKTTQLEMFGDPKTYSEEIVQYFMDKFSVTEMERVLEEQNMRAKCVNFGIVYGRTPPSIAEEFKMPVHEAQEWVNKWFRKYSGAYKFIQQCRAAPIRGQNLITPFGRKRRFQIVSPEKLNDAQNQAANFPEQSIASDCVMHTGMRVIDRAEKEYKAFMINTVYDSLLFELPNDMRRAFELATYILITLKQVPREFGLTKIPFEGEPKIGRTWGALKKTKLPEDLQTMVDNA